MTVLRTSSLASPIGALRLVEHDGKLCGLCFPGGWNGLRAWLGRRYPAAVFEEADDTGAIGERLRAYFDGELTAIEAIPVDAGGSEFQRKVWQALREIPTGRTVSYTDLARKLGQPTASRAVATANAQNPVAVVVPCHRVIHADGSLSGFGGGVERKRWLLSHEGAILC